MRVARRERERRLDARPATGTHARTAVAAVAILSLSAREARSWKTPERTKSLSAVNVARRDRDSDQMRRIFSESDSRESMKESTV